VDEDHPMRTVHRLQGTNAGCQWLLDRWTELRALLERGVPWLAPDKLKAVRLLGHHPIDALDNIEVARVYLASHGLLNQTGDPFQEIMNELTHEEASVFAEYLQKRRYDALAPKDPDAARQMLLDVVDRATEPLRQKAEVLRELAELDAACAADRLSWDDTPEGERLRRYELSANRSLLRMFELLLKVRRTGDELEIATIASFGRSVPTANMRANDKTAPAVATDITPPKEPVQQHDPQIEANLAHENAPNEPNSDVHTISSARWDGHKEFRIDTPHIGRKTGGFGITGKEKMHPAFHRLLTGPEQALLDLAPIFGKSARARFGERKRAGLRRQHPLTPIAFPVAGRRRRLISK
jgi:hypothetical protein